jgi:ribonuclease Z
VLDDTHRILFDAGDGVSAMLDARIHRIRAVALTHAHRDHCSGLLQLLNLTGEAGNMTVVYPDGSGALRALSGFLSGFDTRSTGRVRWNPVSSGATMEVEPARHFLRSFATDHYPRPDPPRTLSLGYQLVRCVDKLRPEFRDLPRPELDAYRRAHGRGAITQTIEDVLLSVTGDTMPLDPGPLLGSRALLHECTFLDIEESRDMAKRGHPHSALDDVLRTAHDAQVEYLALYHISRRYEDALILQTVRDRCAAMALKCSVSVALPGRQYDDLFSHRVWAGADALATVGDPA